MDVGRPRGGLAKSVTAGYTCDAICVVEHSEHSAGSGKCCVRVPFVVFRAPLGEARDDDWAIPRARLCIALYAQSQGGRDESSWRTVNVWYALYVSMCVALCEC